MTTEILETRPGTTHIHIDEIRKKVTRLTYATYELRKNKYFYDWVVIGNDGTGNREIIAINSAGLHGESRHCGGY